MGVLNLWKILSPCCNHIDLNELRNKTLAVDLSIWICENSAQTKSFSQTNTKPYLRALFFRCKYLLELNCKLIFVREGDVIDLKQEAMKKRNQARFANENTTQSQSTQSTKPIQKRSRYDSIANECCELLKYLGITVIRSPCGEAEKACAYLNRIGRCDGVITEDSDVFLYGARTVYKNFSLDNKSFCTIEEYHMDEIEQQLGYDREKLITLALLLGCDYDQKGIAGVGKEMACKFLSEMKEQNENRLLDRLRSWSASQHMSSQSTKYEEKIKKLVFSNGTKFPNEKIIQEFLEFSKMSEILLSKDKYLRIEWNRPSLMAIQLFNDVKQAWAYEYTAEKIIPLIVMYEHGIGTCRSIRPIRISKKKRRAFIEYYEVIWSKMVHPNDKDLSDLNEYVTLEKMDLFENFYPNLVKDFNQEIDCKKNKRNNKKKKEIKNTEDDFDDEMGISIMELYENFDDNKLISVSKTADQNEENKKNKKKKKIKIHKSKDVDDFDEEMGNSIIELYENFEENKIVEQKVKSPEKKIGKNFKVFVLDTESECEEAESKTPDAIEDVDLNMLLKSFNQISLESTKKEMPKIRDKKNTREKEKINVAKKLNTDYQNDDDIIEIPFSQRMKNLYKNAQIFD